MASPSIYTGPWTQLKGVTDSGRALLLEQMEANFAEWLRWGMLGIGDFFNVTIPTSGAYGGNFHQLQPVSDPNFMDGQVWQGARSDWVWESGVQYARQPVAVSGIHLNGAYYPPVSGNYYVDFPRGRVVFNTPRNPTGDKVTCEYSFRNYQVSTGKVPWWREVQFNSLRVDDFQFTQVGSGFWDILAEHRVQLPHVIVDATPDRDVFGLNVGGQHIVRQDVVFNVLAEYPADLDRMVDILTYQQVATLLFFDKNAMADANAFPLTPQGSVASGAKCYPDLVTPSGGGFYWHKAQVIKVRANSLSDNPPLYFAKVRYQVEIDQPW